MDYEWNSNLCRNNFYHKCYLNHPFINPPNLDNHVGYGQLIQFVLLLFLYRCPGL